MRPDLWFVMVMLAASLSSGGVTCALDPSTPRSGPIEYSRALGGADRTPRWSHDGQVVVVSIDRALFAASVSDPGFWRIPGSATDPPNDNYPYDGYDRSPDGVQYSPSINSNGEVAYLNYRYIPRYGFVSEESSPDHRHVGISKLDGTVLEILPLESKRIFHEVGWLANSDRLALLSRLESVYVTDDRPFSMATLMDRNGEVSTITPDDELWRSNLAVAPDGEHVAYHRIRFYQASPEVGQRSSVEIMVRPTEELGKPTRGPVYPDHVNVSQVAWSNDSRHIYFASMTGTRGAPPDDTTVWRMAPGQTTPEKIAIIEPPLRVRMVQPSPDGSKLLITSDGGPWIGPPRMVTIWSIKDKQELRPCCPGAFSASGVWTSWSPDGSRIAVLDLRNHFYQALRVMNPDGSDSKTLIWRDVNGRVVEHQPH